MISASCRACVKYHAIEPPPTRVVKTTTTSHRSLCVLARCRSMLSLTDAVRLSYAGLFLGVVMAGFIHNRSTSPPESPRRRYSFTSCGMLDKARVSSGIGFDVVSQGNVDVCQKLKRLASNLISCSYYSHAQTTQNQIHATVAQQPALHTKTVPRKLDTQIS